MLSKTFKTRGEMKTCLSKRSRVKYEYIHTLSITLTHSPHSSTSVMHPHGQAWPCRYTFLALYILSKRPAHPPTRFPAVLEATQI